MRGVPRLFLYVCKLIARDHFCRHSDKGGLRDSLGRRVPCLLALHSHFEHPLPSLLLARLWLAFLLLYCGFACCQGIERGVGGRFSALSLLDCIPQSSQVADAFEAYVGVPPQRVKSQDVEDDAVMFFRRQPHVVRQRLNLLPRIQVFRVELHRRLEMLDRLRRFALFLPQVSKQVMHLGLVRLLRSELRKDFLRHALCTLPVERPLATKAMALHESKAVVHQFIRATVMRLGLLVAPQLRQLDCQA